jgi:glycosyltransferase involved in cell wall biosynthesis
MIDVVLPVLDEAGALPWVLGRFPPGYRAIVVDNGSTDGSGTLARSLGAAVVNEPQRGFGAACWAGLVAATSEVVCFMDADASLDPRQLPRVAEPVADGRADLMVGSRRPHRGAWPVHARAGNLLLARSVRRRTCLALTDIGPMRAAGREALVSLGMTDRRCGWPLQMVVLAALAGWRVGEVDVDYLGRTGRSKVTGTLTGTMRAVRDMRGVLEAVSASR